MIKKLKYFQIKLIESHKNINFSPKPIISSPEVAFISIFVLDLSIYNGLDTSNRKVVLAPYAVILSRMILQTQNKDHKGIPGTWEFKFKYQEDHENPYSVEKIDLEPLLNKLEEADRNSEKVDLKIHDKTYKISDLANVANKLKLIDEN